MSRKHSLFAGAAFAALSFGAGLLGARTMRGRGAPERPWYRGLAKPAGQPPNWVFAPVWTALYGTIAYSGYRIWRARRSPARSRALGLWAAQLALNAAWTPLFFGARKPRAALADLIALDVGASAYALQGAKVDRGAAGLVAPYLAWLGFATYLNAGIVAKNRT